MAQPGPLLHVMAPHQRPEERRYVLDLILTDWLGFAYDLGFHDLRRTTIRLDPDPESPGLSFPDLLLSTPAADWLTERSMPARPLARVVRPDDTLLPVIFGDAAEGQPAWTETPDGSASPVDVFGSAFWLLTRSEEATRPERDAHQRFPAEASLAVAEGFEDRPLVDEYVDLLWAAMQRLWPMLERKPSTFRLRLTHDIDQPWAASGRPASAIVRNVAGDLINRRDPNLAARRIRSLVDARSGRVDRDPLNAFDFLMDTSERHGLTSTFYVMAGNTPADPDFRYRLTDPPFAAILRRIHERGHEIGLHGSYVSHLAADRLRMEADALRETCRSAGVEQPSWGTRQHYLRFANPDTWRSQEAAGLAHDSTMGFAERIGFRAGTCREYPLFDVVAGRRLALRERPLIAMDTTLVEYLALTPADAAARTRAIVDRCRAHDGDAVLLYHNDGLAGTGQRARYSELIADLVDRA